MQPLFPAMGSSHTDGPSKAAFTWTGGRRFFTLNRGDGTKGPPVQAECDILRWVQPVTGAEMIVGLVVPCPQCEFPIMAGVSPTLFGVGSDGGLHYRAPLRCPAHWPNADSHGNPLGGSRRCGWEAVIIESQAHNLKCPKAQGGACFCGQPGPTL